jgi:hypothetical protein
MAKSRSDRFPLRRAARDSVPGANGRRTLSNPKDREPGDALSSFLYGPLPAVRRQGAKAAHLMIVLSPFVKKRADKEPLWIEGDPREPGFPGVQSSTNPAQAIR